MPMKCNNFIVSVLMVFLAGSLSAQEQYFLDETESRLPETAGVSMSADIADIDNDGDLDIICNAWSMSPPYKSYFLFINNGMANFSEECERRIPGTFFETAAVGFGDIDRDKDYDTYVVSQPGQDRLFVNDGFGYFVNETSERLPSINCGNLDFIFGDVSGDFAWDIVTICMHLTGENRYQLNDGLGYFEDVTSSRMPADSLPDAIGGLADLDNDCDLDMLLGWWDGHRQHLRGLENQAGYFVNCEPGILPDAQARWIATGDIDGDHDLDIVVSFTVDFAILINHGGQFVDESLSRLPIDPYELGCAMIAVADFDNDRDMDIYLARGGYERTDLFLVNDGLGYFQLDNSRIPDTEASKWWPAPFDADADGDLDVFLACSGDGQQRIFINYSTPDTIPPVILAEDLPLGDIDTAIYYPLRISAYDNISVEKGALSVAISYRVNGGVFITEPMVHCGGTIFGYSLPGQPPGAEVQYYILVKDKMDNFITSPPNAPDSLHSFTVRLPSEVAGSPNLTVESRMLVYPNPSNAGFRVSYYAKESEPIIINIYDLAGRIIHSEKLIAPGRSGWFAWEWAGELPSGVYFVELQIDKRKEVARAVLLK